MRSLLVLVLIAPWCASAVRSLRRSPGAPKVNGSAVNASADHSFLEHLKSGREELDSPLVTTLLAFEAALDGSSDADPSVSRSRWLSMLHHMAPKKKKTVAPLSDDEKKELFKEFDANKDGALSIDESALMAPTDNDRYCNAAVAVMCADKDGSGKVEEAEFMATFCTSKAEDSFLFCYTKYEPMCHGAGGGGPYEKPKEVVASKKILDLFKKTDTDGNGEISKEEAIALNPKVPNPECTADITVRCADENGSGSITKAEFVDMYADPGMMNDFDVCKQLNGPTCVKRKKEKREVDYRPQLCKSLYAYEHVRRKCMRLQPQVCGEDCKSLVKKSENMDECKEIQKTICAVPRLGPQPSPLPAGEIPKDAKETVVTLCISRRTYGPYSQLWVGRVGLGLPLPVATKLNYLDCPQVRAFPGMEVGVYRGSKRLAKWTAGVHNELVLVGQTGKDGEDTIIKGESFHDEKVQRPIVCHTAPFAQDFGPLVANIQGKTWYPFTDTNNLEGKLDYLQCEVLALDREDSLKHTETLELRLPKRDRALFTVQCDPMSTLFLLSGDLKKQDAGYKAVNLGHLKWL
eukprot:gnl/MRDRNA2_/MRDRNA2_93196_c0_seq1.p1 gnl/MRDRNA2_/MRDRNA2_93196_c0~~gnl/MRDRNA2_/MRDRNA2_93196_c0_seq1.p1  ORF type:complete len:576 (+),score=131.54 gnl/MRDRNA2_/MRDRNA2_93196_c0_seq1:78-1805(+)